MKSLRTIISLFALPILLLVAFQFFTPSHASALFNYTDHLMDDSVMRANGTMTAGDIQNFLSSKGSGLAGFSDIEDCGSTSGAHYSYYATYYSCGAQRSAAQIIYDAAQAYGINPQVLLATMQKEQSLITTPNPIASQLNYAMGYGCPDSGGCSYAGFFNQLDNAAWQFRVDMELSSGNNYWGYTPASYPCNGATRYYNAALKPGNNVAFINDYGTAYAQFVIPNAATGSLYCYTPHVYPGNAQQYYSGSYWFVYYFNQWFVPYAWQLTSQYAFTDQNKTTPIGLGNLTPGQRVYVGFTAKNTGNTTWTNSGANPVTVGTQRPTAHNSAFADVTWLGPSRPTKLKEASVAPGQTGTFEYWITAPAVVNATNYSAYFGLLQEGVAWMPDIGLYYAISVKPLTYTWQFTGQYAYTDQNKTTPIGLANMSPGQRIYVGFTAKNTGTATWLNSGSNPIKVGTLRPTSRPSAFYDSTWIMSNRPAKMTEASVAPGQTGTFEFWMLAPPTLGGNFLENFGLVAEGWTWLNDTGFNFSGSLLKPSYSWTLTSQYAFADQNKTTPIGLGNLSTGQVVWAGITVKNTGNVTWYNTGRNPVNLGTARGLGRTSGFYTVGWPGYGRPAKMTEASVAPGQTATFDFPMTAPGPGHYLEYLVPVAEGYSWLNDIGLNFNITVH